MNSEKDRVFITGAAGKVGRHVVQQLVERRYNVRVLIHKNKLEGVVSDSVEQVKGDLTDLESLEKAVEGVTKVCHLAAVFDIFPPYRYETNNDIVFKVNVTGTYNLLEAIRKSGTVNQVIFGSSESVYASDVKDHIGTITEEESLFPGRFYSLTKIIGEDMVRNYKYLFGIYYTILRFAWILDGWDIVRIFEYETWRDMVEETEREQFDRSCMDRKALFVPIYEDGSARVDHIVDGEDAALAVVLSIENPQSKGEIFNIAGPKPFRYDEIVEKPAKELSLRWHKGKILGAYPYELSIEKAKRLIGYNPKYSIEATLAKAFNK